MKTNLFNTLLVATLVITSSCNSSKSSSSSSQAGGKSGGTTGTSQLTEAEIKDYSATLSDMFKNSMTTLTIKKDGCVMESKELNVDLTANNNQKIEFKKTVSSTASKECSGGKIEEINQVEVSDFDNESSECKLSGTKTGDILEVKSSCDSEVSIVDLKAKTLKTASGEFFMQAVTIERAELLGYLSNIKIIHYKKNPNDSFSVAKVEVGNANTILNLGL